MKTLEERKEIAIERLMEYTNTQSYEDCWYKLDTILRIMAGWDVINNYNSKELHELIFEEIEEKPVCDDSEDCYKRAMASMFETSHLQ